MALGRQNRSARVGCRRDGAAIGPGLQVFYGIDDAAAELAIGGTGSVGAMFFECAAGQAQETSCLGCSQIAWRQAGGVGGHDRASVGSVRPLAKSGGSRPPWRSNPAKGDGEVAGVKIAPPGVGW